MNPDDVQPEWARKFYASRMQSFTEVFRTERPIVGMVHLHPLPGAPAYNGEPMDEIIDSAVKDAKALVENGVDGIIVENMWDLPYFVGKKVPPEEMVAHGVAAREVIRAAGVPAGITVIHNGGRVTLGIAKAAGAKFMRVDLLTGSYLWDTGDLDHGVGAELLRLRKELHAGDIKFFADVYKKHAVMFPGIDPETHAVWTDFYMADALIVTGRMTGAETPLELVKRVKGAAPERKILIGSGFSVDNAEKLMTVADGAIVGTSLKYKGMTVNPVDPERVRRLMAVVRKVRGE
ncbi:MAG: BtpA/SgcQ family protein [Nitrososphaerota archaeon]|nr:BtpA/SgcQ family protein [Nitrososphaerota archaeon]